MDRYEKNDKRIFPRMQILQKSFFSLAENQYEKSFILISKILETFPSKAADNLADS